MPGAKGIELLTYKIFKEIVLGSSELLEEKELSKFTSYVRNSATTLSNAGLLGFITILGKKAIRGPTDGRKAHLLLFVSVVKFLKETGEISIPIEIDESYVRELLRKNLEEREVGQEIAENLISPVVEKVFEVNQDLMKKSRITDLLMGFLVWIKSFSEAML